LDPDIETWAFDPLANATDCPNASRSLSYNYTDRSYLSDLISVRTVEAEETSHTGTISFCTNVIRDQLALTDDQMKTTK
jgi:glycerol kinase